MNYSIFIVFLIQGYLAFFLDGITNAPGGSSNSLSDQHFNLLMELLRDERQSRVKLENVVLLLQQELAETKLKCTSFSETVKTIETRFSEFANKTANKDTDHMIIQANFANLKTSSDSLKEDFNTLKNDSMQFEQKLTKLEQLKGVTDSKNIFALENKTNYLETEIRKTNLNLDSVVFEASARKQDFVALLKKTDVIEQNYENHTRLLEYKTNAIITEQQKYGKNLQRINNRVIVTSCVQNRLHLTAGQPIPFKSVHEVHGYTNMKSLKTTGIFTSDRNGIYLVTASVETDAASSGINILRNGEYLADAFMSYTGAHHLTATIATTMKVNDTITVTARVDIFVYNGYESCLTILQVK